MFRITAIALAALTLAATAPAWGWSPAVSSSPALSQDEEPKVDASKVRYGKLAEVDLKVASPDRPRQVPDKHLSRGVGHGPF